MNIKGLVNGDSRYIDFVNNSGVISYVQNGQIVKNSVVPMVLISSQSELQLLGDYAPGTIAYTAGYKQMWQKAPNGTWAAFD